MQCISNMAQSRSELNEHVVKGSFHQGNTSVFSPNSVGHQCVPNCVIAAHIILLYPCQDGQVIHWIIYCDMGISYTTALKKLLICYKLMILVHKQLHSKTHTIFAKNSFLGESEKINQIIM